jgi:beta-barrel assembly-enhancing protease
MDHDKELYFDGTSARPTEVRVLLFNDAVNIYDATSNNFIASFPVKTASVTKTGDSLFVYLNNSGTAYLQFHAHNEKGNEIVSEVNSSKQGWVKALMSQKIVVLIGIAIALIAGIYFSLITLIPGIGAAMISTGTEVQMGNKLREIMLREESVIGATVDSAATQKLQAFADQVRLSEKYPIRVTVVRSKMVNAYALPGGQIVVYSGMLEKISDRSSLVALLAHEASHVNERHSLRSLLRSAADAIIVSVIFNDASGVTAAIVGHAQTLKGLEYSRGKEREADEHGMQIMLRNNVDLSGMKRLMTILQKEGDVPESVSFLSSHPLTKQRIRAADKFIKKHPQKVSENLLLENAFRRLKSDDNKEAE